MEEFDKLIDEVGDEIYNFCIYLARNKDDGEDLFQETIIKAIEAYAKIDFERNPKSYIISIAINTWKNIVRKKARRNFIAKIVNIDDKNDNFVLKDDFNIEDKVVGDMTNNVLLELVNDLSDKYRIPIILFYLENMKIVEIVEVLNKPEGTIKRQLHQGRLRLKKEMEVRGYAG